MFGLRATPEEMDEPEYHKLRVNSNWTQSLINNLG